ncbi:selenocysteine lyase-like [Sinocyclocheilus rhinocerous]|uniref:selenocysteine lyase-like n=1 Tax=Sinocyclocheilus rhinocerous TaxID=307959 RepID=UPI0007B84922|nr:PREDICTED: selenocysteine lyase-like [Sinocyclocheilus rhinocerous]XP_016424160.1 PREDICTED: selenocysteine lyase-like [Sinocyclocheilus rhinocerous]
MAEKTDPPVILGHNLWGTLTHHFGSDLHHHDVADGPDRIYMDYNATTPVDPEVVRVVTDALTEAWGNPSSNYLPGLKARDIIYHSRDTIARMVGGKAADIIFTSGGTEQDSEGPKGCCIWLIHISTIPV